MSGSELDKAKRRFQTALDALESASAVKASRSFSAATTDDEGAMRDELGRLMAENDSLQIARRRDATLREEAIEKVDFAIAALREALDDDATSGGS
ncbi:MAG: hypothetical protein AAFQ73_07175 [Pseudomonadota bacterium]